jgi:hypothetical protein
LGSDQVFLTGEKSVSFWRQYTNLNNQAAVADTEKLGIVFDGIEMIVEMISKYAIFEQLYLQDQMQATRLFRIALVRLYASILSFLAQAKYFYAERTGLRMVKSTFHVGLSKMTKLKQEIQDEQVAVVEIARLIDAEHLRAVNGDIKSMPSELTNMRKALDQLQSLCKMPMISWKGLSTVLSGCRYSSSLAGSQTCHILNTMRLLEADDLKIQGYGFLTNRNI